MNFSLRILMVCPELPTANCPGSMAPAVRQFESLRELGVHVDVFDMRGIPKLKYLQAVPQIRRMARNVDLVHAHFGYCGWLAKSQRSKPVVVSFMGDDLLGTPKANGELEWLSERMARSNCSLAKMVDSVIVKSREMANVIAPREASIIPNGVDLEVFQPMDRRACRAQLGLSQEARLVLFPGNPQNPRKGFDLARLAVEVARETVGEVTIVPLWNVDPIDVPVYMNACDAMLMTSLIEGSPNVVKEAMACDLPVVGVPVGDVHELIADVPGYAACQRDVTALGAAIVDVLSGRQTSVGRRAIVEAGLDLESVARRVIGVYEDVLGRTRMRKVRPGSVAIRPDRLEGAKR